jgi:two-component system LytT family response regulator
MKAIIVDDEPLARERIRQLLERVPDAAVVAECEDGSTAIETIRLQKPDVVFLDVQMPGLSGIDVVEQLGREAPFTVFVTAYDQYAIKAFELHALDYLLKPFDRQRFDATIERIRDALCRPSLSTRSNLRALVKAWQKTSPARLIVKDGGRIHAIRISDIDWIEAAGNYANLHCGKTSYLMRETLSALETRLAPQRFVRIHRSTIVNLDRVRELKSSANGEYHVTLESGIRLALSRTYKRRLISLLRH